MITYTRLADHWKDDEYLFAIYFPRLLDMTMASSTVSEYRKALLQDVRGEVLEIGFGTGLNLAHYPEQIQKLTTIDVNAGMTNGHAWRLPFS